MAGMNSSAARFDGGVTIYVLLSEAKRQISIVIDGDLGNGYQSKCLAPVLYIF